MITIEQIPSTYKLTINEGLDEAMDMHDLTMIGKRIFDRENKNPRNLTGMKMKSTYYGTNLLDRFETARAKAEGYAGQAAQALCSHPNAELQMDNRGRTWTWCPDCDLEGD